MTMSQPMKAFLLDYGRQLQGKRIMPFLTEGGYGAGNSVQLIREYTGSNDISRALVIDGNKVGKADRAVESWLNANNIAN